MKLSDIARRLFGGWDPQRVPADPWRATAEEIRRISSPCPICKTRDLTGHTFGEFASQIAIADSKELASFFDLYRSREWQQLHQIRDFDASNNAAILYVLFCVKGSCMVAVRDPVELYDSDELLDVTVLDDRESATIKEMQIETHPL